MSEDEIRSWKEARPFVVGIVAALIFSKEETVELSFEKGEQFAREFERRNNITE